MAILDEKTESLVRDLPDAEGARLFFERLQAEHPRAVKTLMRDAGLCSDALALAAWSPLLATTLAQNPDYLAWLARERSHLRVKSREELTESLARFALTNSQLDAQVLLARFRRRELLRIYLHDIRNTTTIVEITEELSNLADAILEHALNIARQELDNRYGSPQCTDEKGRTATASFSIVALGKLGSFELNYASDIDLLFLYSDEGKTSGKGTRGEITNREYFNKLAETVSRIVGQQSGEGAAYRVDLRLRPFGRDGALATSLEEAVRYYRETAQAWELQALIRSRAAAGQPALYTRFAARIRHRVYAAEETVERALTNVRLAKQKIDRHHALDTRGFNVKLGRGGIREIEFIAQALQLAFGARDEWLRAAHTLISLGRLADRHLITERERTELSDAYVFLRKLEHRLQMEHGLQTHSLPEEPAARRLLVARRMDFAGLDALTEFDRALSAHTTNVRAAYDRVFGQATEERADNDSFNLAHDHSHTISERPVDAEKAATGAVASIFHARLTDGSFEQSEGDSKQSGALSVDRLADALTHAAHETLSPRRALMLTARIASSLDKASGEIRFSKAHLRKLINLCGASEFFGEMIASNPALILALPLEGAEETGCDYRAVLNGAVESEDGFGAEMSRLRREWAKLIVEIGSLDAAGAISMFEANARQTALAAASLDAGCLIASRELNRRYGEREEDDRLARVAVLGLGRLGGGGMDYGSDLDVVLVYDDALSSPVKPLVPAEAFARFSEFLVAALSSVTRDGYLYRVDLRLRPDGKNGLTCSGARAFTDYLKERAVEWEWLAYVKLRAAAGDLRLGERVEREARAIIHKAARDADRETLRLETRRVRERLEYEKTGGRAKTIDIKYGAGGMLDVYFATRFLQLRDNVPDNAEGRSTRAVLERLRESGSLGEDDYQAMKAGYALLRALDHHLRLIVGRSTRLPSADHPTLRDIASKLAYESTNELTASLSAHMSHIRAAYDRITK
ncbi:MAG: [glutamine synthetase] adenylyltransferase / [glutamine synthetase]-adenylyl-L-tyrosine [Acidobacteriota bacterium]|nr:[glutamine synthetase] adenylyltransferase / [glutamine synthetase]-adenylyl-L-tyrosine [Acidobacteriota bacterium]